MRSLRRSLNNNQNHGHGHGYGSGSGHGHTSQSSHSHSHTTSHGGQSALVHGGSGGAAVSPATTVGANPLSRPSEKVAPPQKVIKALNSHRSTNPQELSYSKGDFWYVTGEREGWYEALNPVTGSRGLVPKEDFEEFHRGGRQASAQSPTIPQHSSQMSHSQTSNGPISPTMQMQTPPTPPSATTPVMMVGGGGLGHGHGHGHGSDRGSGSKGKHQPLYAIVQYDFHAERPDELEAKAGEPIVVIAQSNHEWFVAKPIGRLGGPGLIPVAFVEIRDPVSGKPVDVFPTTIPQVEEWKKATAEYKAAAIPLGRLDLAPDQRVTNSPFSQAANTATSSSLDHDDIDESATAVTSTTATARPPRSMSPSLNGDGAHRTQNSGGSGKSHRKYRPEQDPLLPPGELIELGVPSFHNESGIYWFRLHAAIIPDDPQEPAYTLILYRTYEDFYDFQITLLDTFPTEAGRPEEADMEPPQRVLPYMPGPVDEQIDDELTEYRRDELDSYVKALLNLRDVAGYILRHDLIRTFFAAKYGDYCEEMERPDEMERLNQRMGNSTVSGAQPPQLRAHKTPNHTGGGGNGWTFPKHSREDSRSGQPQQTRNGGHSSDHREPGHARNMSSSGSNNINNLSVNVHSANAGHNQWNNAYGKNSNLSAVTPILPSATSQLPAAPAPAMPAPARSAAQSNAAFVKIKIYDRATDDLIALRVHPAVTYDELLDKVRARLGPNISILQYRMGGGRANAPYRHIRDTHDLTDWMSTEEKLVLYAEQ